MLVCILILFVMVDMLIVIMMIKLIVMIEIFTLSPEGGRLHPEQGRFISLPDSDYTRATRLHICIVFIIALVWSCPYDHLYILTSRSCRGLGLTRGINILQAFDKFWSQPDPDCPLCRRGCSVPKTSRLGVSDCEKVLIWRRLAANISHHLMLLVPNVNYFRSILYCNALHSMLPWTVFSRFQFIAMQCYKMMYNDIQCIVIWFEIHCTMHTPAV